MALVLPRLSSVLRGRLLLAVAAAHLALVLIGALHLCPWGLGPPGRLAAYYSALCGADTGYSFFAPGVGPQARATFTLVDAAGNTAVDTLATGATREADIRVEHLLELVDHDLDPALRAPIVASWAAAMFTRHPDAAALTIDVGHDRLASMAETRRGEAPRWRSVLRARVTRAGEENAP